MKIPKDFDVLTFLLGASEALRGNDKVPDGPRSRLLGRITGKQTRRSMENPGNDDFKGVEAIPLANLLDAWIVGIRDGA